VADIFVSYTSNDRDWAFWIGQELETLGHTPHIHDWEISAGGDIAGWMEERHDKADNVLLVVSEVYLTKSYSKWERLAAQWAAANERPNFALPVLIEDCKLPTLLAQIKRCELYGIDEEENAQSQLVEYLRPAAKPTNPVAFPPKAKAAKASLSADAVPFPGGKRALSNIPISVPRHFLGRDLELAAIDEALKGEKGRVAIAALHGLRGVGKTSLAAAYAERHRNDYRATWWIRAQTPETMRADLVALGVRLGWVRPDEKEEPALETVRERLRDEGERLLLIYDNAINAEKVEPHLPPGGSARVIVTSNAPDWLGVADSVAIEVWTKEIGADYLIARTGRKKERAHAEALSEALGGLPLAHEQAAAYCMRIGLPLGEYCKRLEAAPARLLEIERDAPVKYRLTVAKAFAIAIVEAAKLHPAAESLITYAALLAPEPIPLFLFSEAREKFGEPLASHLADDGLDDAVAALRAFALVYPRAPFSDPVVWPRARRLDVLALDLVKNAAPPAGAEASASRLLDRLATYKHGALAAYSEARALLERALKIGEEALGPEHPDVATVLHNLAGVLWEQDELGTARSLHERALAIREKVLNPEHPSVATSLNNLAGVFREQGDLVMARPLYERALAIRQKALSPQHPDLARSLTNLATAMFEQGDPTGARPLFERAMAIREKTLPPEHPDVAQGLNDFARLLQEQGDLPGARLMFKSALATYERALGPGHPYTNIVNRNLAKLHVAEGAHLEALEVAQAAVAAHEKVLGVHHRWTKKSAESCAVALAALGRADEATALRARYRL
jgi:tetratricopeptide (TPR) repeat protein